MPERDEPPLPANAVVIRGGELRVALVCRRVLACLHDWGFSGFSVTCLGELTVTQLVSESQGLADYAVYFEARVGDLRAAGFELAPTGGRRHYSVVLPDGEETTVRRAALVFRGPFPTPREVL